jgi:hypothetical protein
MAVNHRDPAAVEDAWRRIFAFLTTMCAQAELEQLYSARSAAHYDRLKRSRASGRRRYAAGPPSTGADAAAGTHPSPWNVAPDSHFGFVDRRNGDSHGPGVLHVDGDFERIGEVRPLTARLLG